MPEKVGCCPLCGSESRVLFDQRDFRGHQVTNVRCLGCGLVYQSPRMTSTESQEFYEAEYRLLYQGQEGPDPKDLAVQAARARVTLDFIRGKVGACSSILDIGCSTGILLTQLREHYQAQGIGVEPGSSYRQYAQSLGLEVHSTLEEIKEMQLPPFELVSMMHVLEHLPNPVEYLQDIRNYYVKAGGWLLIEVPNLYCHDSFEVAHLVAFSPHTLTQVVQKAGFRVIQLRVHGQPRSKLIPLYLTLIAQPGEITAYTRKPEYFVPVRRQMGFLYRRVVTRLFPHQAWQSPEKAGG